ncbi:class I adenylate-forming enzyme family protein [Pseudomonas aeruginosa]|uniref:class I adenylate-forming enzyme family protein n=1 Tax=Pseudomonas aeruginosa TaxID=287 RepID=UPI000F525A88|nr:AMP-binding protein [Pseudomonas aeruginosa]MBT1079826.1 AMP-binding protein [Pseudomonas aeruginosa]MCS7968334.1 AMP-binding protein [Pseudomonas aeruginosa]MCS8136980.1 AMP-binding protein [Pseudomonas aeruginosa]MCS8179015.1 AMP-binding protein [Pseudomonas aeruginosa]MCS8191250.1 AMP-binding protein [Pseudomonas aeruginosa]
MLINFSNHFESLANRFGDREAIVNTERNRRYSYREFHLLTNRIVNMMQSTLGLGLNDRFINILENDNLSLLHFPTIFKGPATAAFCNYRDSLSEHTWQVECAKAKVAFIEKELLGSHYDMLRERQVTVVVMDRPDEPKEGVHYFWDLLRTAPDHNPEVELNDRDHCAIIRFTGGTTGKGKPAMYSIDNWLNCRDTAFAITDKGMWSEATRVLHIAPISHGSGMLYLPSFYSGGCNVTQNTPDLKHYCTNIQKEQITHSFLVPTILYRLLEIDADMSSLRYMLYGAAPMSPGKLKQLQAKMGNIFVQVYGSTEHFGFSSNLSIEQHIINTPEDEVRLSSAGQPTSGVEFIIVDDNGRKVAPGESGEIWMRSRGTCLGYLNAPEKTAEEFHNGFWKSGDIGYMDKDGFIYLIDRKKDMIISGGFNIYANEVEAALNCHPAVLMSAVVGIPHEEWGEAVHAEVLLRDDSEASEQELINFVKNRIGNYKAPKSVKVVKELPMSVVGKILRRKVREHYWGEGRKIS